jgi:hypothetical protein
MSRTFGAVLGGRGNENAVVTVTDRPLSETRAGALIEQQQQPESPQSPALSSRFTVSIVVEAMTHGTPAIPNLMPDGFAAVSDGSRFGVMNHRGEVVVPFEYLYLSRLSDEFLFARDSRGNGGAIDLNGNVVVPLDHALVFAYYGGTFIVTTPTNGFRNLTALVDMNGDFIVPYNRYDTISWFTDGLARVRVADDEGGPGRYGFINTRGEVVVPVVYEWAQPFENGVAVVNTADGQFAYNTRGERVDLPPISSDLPYPWEGMSWIYGYLDHLGSFSEDLLGVFDGAYWGFVNRRGEVVISPRYDYVNPFADGLATVGAGQWRETPSDREYFTGVKGIIDTDGGIVLPLLYDELVRIGSVDGVSYVWAQRDESWSLLAITPVTDAPQQPPFTPQVRTLPNFIAPIESINPDCPEMNWTAISDRAGLEAIHNAENLSGNFYLTADIDLGGELWRYPIGRSDDNNSRSPAFRGTFDGQGYVIRNMTIAGNHRCPVGLFAALDGATVRNVGLESTNIDISADDGHSVGAISGTARNSTISNVYNTGRITVCDDEYNRVGGIVGVFDSGVITDSYNTADVIGYIAGGIVADNVGDISNCFNTGNITGMVIAGGIVGHGEGRTAVERCFNSGSITANNVAAGIVASLDNSGNHITDSYNVGDVSITREIEGWFGTVCGINSAADDPFRAVNVYNAGRLSVADNPDFRGLYHIDSIDLDTFDFENVWTIIEGVNGGLPVLRIFERMYTADEIPRLPIPPNTPEGFDNYEYQRLVAFALQGNNLTILGWNLSAPDSWRGITWSGGNGSSVTEIDLSWLGLIGNLEISGFFALRNLNIAGNDLAALDITNTPALTTANTSGNSRLAACDCRSCPRNTCGFNGGRFGFGRVTDGSEHPGVTDALQVLRYLVGLPSAISGCDDARAAANIVNPGLGRPQIGDALVILRYVVGLPNMIANPELRHSSPSR